MVYEVDIIIISFNNFLLIEQCIDSIYKSENALIQNIIVVDNASTDNTVASLKAKYANITLIENQQNFGYAKAVNIGLRSCISDYTIVSNNDVVYYPDTIHKLLLYLFEHKNAGAAGPKQRYPDGRLQYMGGELPSVKLGLEDLFFISGLKLRINRFIEIISKSEAIRYGYIDGAVIACRTEQIKSIGGFDESFFFYSEEADFCKRLSEINLFAYIVPSAEIIHYRGAATGNNFNPGSIAMLIESQWIYCSKHLSSRETSIYARLEYLSYKWKSILNQILGNKSKSDNFREYFNNWKRIIKENKGG